MQKVIRKDNKPSDQIELFRFIVNHFQHFVTVINRNYRYEFANAPYLQAQKKKSEEIGGRHVADIWGEEVFEAIIKHHLDRCFSGQIIKDESWFEFPGLGLCCFEVNYFPFRDSEGAVTHAVVISRDLTAQKNLEEQFLQAQKMELVGRMTAGVAHDFNNVLTVISGYTGMLRNREKDLGDRAQRDLDLILNASKKAERLAEQLLTFSRKSQARPKVFDLNELLIGTDKMLRRLVGPEVVLEIVTEIEAACIKADPAHIEQVIMNLTANARDAMPKGGKLLFEIKNVQLDKNFLKEKPDAKLGDYVLLSATDTGTGIPDEIQRKIFEPFFTTKEKGRGTGLGLATCQAIAEEYKGFIRLNSKVGEGTTFQVYFPRTKEKPEAPSTQPEIKTIPRGTETILLVEDEAAVRALSLRILCELGYRVLEAANGQEALQIQKSHQKDKIHLVITNVMMPLMPGTELAERIHQARADIKILFISGFDQESVSREGWTDLNSGYLQKPFWPAVLAMRVRDLLDRRS